MLSWSSSIYGKYFEALHKEFKLKFISVKVFTKERFYPEQSIFGILLQARVAKCEGKDSQRAIGIFQRTEQHTDLDTVKCDNSLANVSQSLFRIDKNTYISLIIMYLHEGFREEFWTTNNGIIGLFIYKKEKRKEITIWAKNDKLKSSYMIL